MFTGIIEQTGNVVELVRSGETARLTVSTKLVSRLRLGDSIAVNGVCLTAVEVTKNAFSADLLKETLDRTTLGESAKGRLVNLELPTAAGSPLGGHIVQGHIDGVAHVISIHRESGSETTWRLAVEVPHTLRRYMAEKGSVTIDGISLTVAKLRPDGIEVSIIPHTYSATTVATLKPGSRVNLETDALAKYAESLQRRSQTTLTLDSLIRSGY